MSERKSLEQAIGKALMRGRSLDLAQVEAEIRGEVAAPHTTKCDLGLREETFCADAHILVRK